MAWTARRAPSARASHSRSQSGRKTRPRWPWLCCSLARRHLPPTVFDAARWKAAVGEALWPKVVYVLNRGGRFQAYTKAFDGEKFANKYGQLVNLYLEKYARSKSPMSGKGLPGVATYLPIQDVLGREIHDRAAAEGVDEPAPAGDCQSI